MTPDEHEKLPPEEKETFSAMCGFAEMLGRRKPDEVLFHHTDHEDRPDIQYSGWEKLD